MLDEYMAFCEKALLPREDRMPRKCCSSSSDPKSDRQRHVPARNATTDQFPVHRDEETSVVNMVGEDEDPTVKSTMTANAIDKGHDHLRPGEQYTIYHTRDILGSLPTDLELVVSRAAKWAGVDDDYVAAVVERLERRVLKWWDRQQRKERTERTTAPTSD